MDDLPGGTVASLAFCDANRGEEDRYTPFVLQPLLVRGSTNIWVVGGGQALPWTGRACELAGNTHEATTALALTPDASSFFGDFVWRDASLFFNGEWGGGREIYVLGAPVVYEQMGQAKANGCPATTVMGWLH